MFFVGLGAAVFLLDTGIKELILGIEDSDLPMEVKHTGGKLYLYKNYNSGFPFGFLKGYPQLVRMAPLMVISALAGVFTWLLGRKGFILEKIALAFTLGGGLSNLYDRFKRHHVIDYINIRWKCLKEVVFNFGDFFIVLGILMLLTKEIICSLRE